MISMNKFKPTIYLLFLSLMLSCSADDEAENVSTTETYSTEVYLTDSPVDNTGVQGIFITIAEVRVNGMALESFQRTTLDVSSLTEGNTELLGHVDLEAGNTSEIVLVLDDATDASGNTPGNYVLTADGEKEVLIPAQNSIVINDHAEIFATGENQLILDFDLRKSLRYGAEGGYSFVSSAQLSNSFRAVNKLETGTITGKISNRTATGAEAVVVYAYESGSYSESETQSNADGLLFSNAVSSTAVNDANGNFSLHFLEEGNYKLVFASYEDEDNDGKLELQGELDMNLEGELALNEITVESNSTVNLDLSIEGFLNL